MKLTYKKFEEIAKKEEICLPDFYLDAEIAPRTVSEWKAGGFVPTCVLESFLRYKEKLNETKETLRPLETEKILEAKRKGFRIVDGKILIPSASAIAPLEIPDELSHLVRYSIPAPAGGGAR
jgi:hypothetical protein